MQILKGYSGAPAVRRGYIHETEKNCCRKWCYFSDVYEMTKLLEDRIENGKKINFPLRFSYVNLKIFAEFQILIDFYHNLEKICH